MYPRHTLSALLTFLLLQPTTVLGHMYLYTPPTFNSTNNPHRTTPPDPYLNYPYNCCGRTDNVPCKGYLSLLGTPDGAPVATWALGSVQEFSLAGSLNQAVHGGNHYGGSAQVGFSVDNGTSWKVAMTFQGNHPRRDGGDSPEAQTFEFTVPGDTPEGDVVFAWAWVNHDVVQEFQMSCAAVTIVSAGDDTQTSDQAAGQSSQAQVEAPYPTTLATAGSPTPTSSPYCNCSCNPPSPRPSNYRRSPPVSINTTPVAFTDRPDMLLFMDLVNGCMPPPSTAELKFPNPGPDVVDGDGAYPLELPTPAQKCGYSDSPAGY
jgi:hypothetical protein